MVNSYLLVISKVGSCSCSLSFYPAIPNSLFHRLKKTQDSKLSRVLQADIQLHITLTERPVGERTHTALPTRP